MVTQPLPKKIYFAVEGVDAFRMGDARRRLVRELRNRDTGGQHVVWDDPLTWDAESKRLLVVCVISDGTLRDLQKRASGELAHAIRRLFPSSDPTIRPLKASLVLAPRPVRLSTLDRWGWYAVTLFIEADFLRDDPESGPYVAEELRQIQQFREASFGWSQTDGVGTFSVEVLARSAHAAEGEARDALVNLSYAAVRDPGDFTVRTLKCDWVAARPRAGLEG